MPFSCMTTSPWCQERNPSQDFTQIACFCMNPICSSCRVHRRPRTGASFPSSMRRWVFRIGRGSGSKEGEIIHDSGNESTDFFEQDERFDRSVNLNISESGLQVPRRPANIAKRSGTGNYKSVVFLKICQSMVILYTLRFLRSR